MEASVKILRNIILSLIVGALFGWAFSTKFPAHAAILSGTAAAAFMYGGIVVSARLDRRESRARRTGDDDELG
jgi:uncharacterized membrane protein YoaK (UPF0700 family)